MHIHMHIPIIMEALYFMIAPPFRIDVVVGFKTIIRVGFMLVKCFPKDLHSAINFVRLFQRIRLSVFFSMPEPIAWNSCTMMTINSTVTIITGVL